MRTISLLFALLFVFGSCGTEGGSQPETPDAGHELPIALGKITLPKDEAPHSDPIEWWYYTGFIDAEGKPYGFEVVVFQYLTPGQTPTYLAHFAITDVSAGKFSFASKKSAEDRRKSAPHGFDLEVDGWRVVGGGGLDRLSAQMDGFTIDFQLTSTKQPVAQFGDGVMYIASTAPFYYYSYPRMTVSGTLEVDGKKHAVRGDAWMDHQWGTMGRAGWEWYSLRLDDQTELMLFDVKSEGKPFRGGTYVDADGKTEALTGGDYVVERAGTWISPHSTARYSQGWSIKLPKRDLAVTVTPVLADQEIRSEGSPPYWEGLCKVSGTRAGQPIGGYAYVELTGAVMVGKPPPPNTGGDAALEITATCADCKPGVGRFVILGNEGEGVGGMPSLYNKHPNPASWPLVVEFEKSSIMGTTRAWPAGIPITLLSYHDENGAGMGPESGEPISAPQTLTLQPGLNKLTFELKR